MKCRFNNILISFFFLIYYQSSQIISIQGANILYVSFFTSPSHRQAYEPLFNALIERGHNLTAISQIKPSNANPKIREIIGIPSAAFGKVNFFELRAAKKMMKLTDLLHVIDPLCKQTYDLPQVKEVLSSGEIFDLIFVSAFMNECVFGFLHRLGAPYILIAPMPVFSTTAAFFGTPVPPSFVPGWPSSNTHKMNLMQRTMNTVGDLMLNIYASFYLNPNAEGIYREKLGQDLSSVKDIGKNASMMFVNSHFTISYPRPLLPDIVEVGGMHCRPSNLLPKDLDDFLTGSGEHGTIYFSLGSIVRGEAMPDAYRKMFVNAFSKLKQRVLWKWESEKMADLPANTNIKLSKWLPQQDVLGHPNVRLFITHGGLLSTEEAVYHGVPLIGIPFFADQDWNMKQSETAGFAITLEFGDLSEDNILEAINQILNENRYSKNVQALSLLFKDRLETPLATAVFWSEYVIRHKGAGHLRSPARDLNVFQYYSLDVIVALITGSVIILLILFAISKFVIRMVMGKIRADVRTYANPNKKSN